MNEIDRETRRLMGLDVDIFRRFAWEAIFDEKNRAMLVDSGLRLDTVEFGPLHGGIVRLEVFENEAMTMILTLTESDTMTEPDTIRAENCSGVFEMSFSGKNIGTAYKECLKKVTTTYRCYFTKEMGAAKAT